MVNRTRLPVYFAHTPSGTSNWAVVHFLQLVNSKRFAKMDYGKAENLKRYGQVLSAISTHSPAYQPICQVNPPDYPLENINTKDIAFLYGAEDWLADPKDVCRLRAALKGNHRTSSDVLMKLFRPSAFQCH